MQLNNLKPTTKRKSVKRVGRGGKRGTYSGKGQKGQKSRAGKRFKPVIRELIKRYPKLRGYKQNTVSQKPVVVNLDAVVKRFGEGEIVSPISLLEKKLISRISGKLPSVKILSKGEITKKLIFEAVTFSEKAKEKIEKSQSTIK